MIKAGADVNLKNNKQTPLTAACMQGYLDLTKKLLKAGADVNLKNCEQSPLIAACKREYVDLNIVQELINAGADITSSEVKSLLFCQNVVLILIASISNNILWHMRVTGGV